MRVRSADLVLCSKRSVKGDAIGEGEDETTTGLRRIESCVCPRRGEVETGSRSSTDSIALQRPLSGRRATGQSGGPGGVAGKEERASGVTGLVSSIPEAFKIGSAVKYAGGRRMCVCEDNEQQGDCTTLSGCLQDQNTEQGPSGDQQRDRGRLIRSGIKTEGDPALLGPCPPLGHLHSPTTSRLHLPRRLSSLSQS